MASYGAAKEMPAPVAKSKGPKVGAFHHLEMHPGENGGAMVQHHHEYTSPDGYVGVKEHGSPHLFGESDGGKLAAHIAKHIGIAMPGKSMAKEDEPEEEEENVSGHAGKD